MASFDLGGLLADPNSAGIMGLAQGLLASSGASRLPVTMGAALANGMQGMQQGFTGSIGLQQKLTQMKLLQAAMASMNGGGQPPQSFAPQADPSAAASSALSAGAQGMTPPNSDPNPLLPPGAMGAATNRPGPTPMSASLMDSIQAQPPQMGGLMGNGGQAGAAPSGASIYGKTPADLYKQGMLFSLAGLPAGAEMMKIAVEHDPSLAAMMPTDITKMGMQGGMSPQQIQAANAAGVAKANYIPPVSGRPGGYLTYANGRQEQLPQVPEGYTAMKDASGQWQIVPVAGGTQAMTDSAAAKLRGQNQETIAPKNILPTLPNGQVQPASVNTILHGGVTGGTSSAGMDGSATGPQGLDISKLTPQQIAYLAKTDPQAYANGVADFARTSVQPAASPTGLGPAFGQQTAANAAQGAPSEQMKSDYATMAGAGPQAQQSLEYLDHMLQLAQKKPAYMGMGVGGLPGMTNFSTDAAEYEKARASYLASQGKALGSGPSNTDAARATLNDSVPEYGKPQDAMIRGLTDQRNQLVTSMIRRQVLAPVYQTGDEKTYTSLANGFDQNIKPSMAPILQMPPSAQRAAVQSAIKANPSLRPSFEWAFNHGLLK